MRTIASRFTFMAPAEGEGTAAGGTTANADAGGADDVAKLKAELAAAQQQLNANKKAQDEAAKAADEATKKQLADQGQHKALADKLAAEKAELEKRLAGIEGDAAFGKAQREKLQKQIDESAAKLAPADKAILDAITDLDAKAAFIARLGGAAPATGTQPAGASAAAGGKGVDIAALLESGMTPDAVRARHPTEFNAFIANAAKASKKPATGTAAWFRN